MSTAQEEKRSVQNLEQCKMVIVTGANQGIGRSIAKRISSIKDEASKQYIYSVVIICRNENKGNQTVIDLQKQSGNKEIHLITCDVSSHKDVQNKFIKQFTKILTVKDQKK